MFFFSSRISNILLTSHIVYRSTPVFSAFIAGIAKVLDRNPDWGKEVLPLTLHLLLFCPAPEVVNKSRKPNYTLGILDTHVRHSWLMTLLIYLYKVREGTYCIVPPLTYPSRYPLTSRFHFSFPFTFPFPSSLEIDERSSSPNLRKTIRKPQTGIESAPSDDR